MKLETYRKILPKTEFEALTAWLSTFFPFQLDWLLDSSALAIVNKSRQIGFSHTTAAVAVLWAAFHGELTTIISIGDRESVEVQDKVRKHATILHRLGSVMARIAKGKDNRNEIHLGSGGRVLALPSSGGRGFTGNVFLDEFAYQQQAQQVWDATAPVTSLGGRMRVASTPNGVGNKFNELWEHAQKPGSTWSAHRVSLQDAKDQGYKVDEAKCWEFAVGDPRVFAQMYECSFLDGALQYIPTAMLDADQCIYDVLPNEDGVHYAGLDIGKEVDLTVLVVLRVVRGIRTVVSVQSMKRTDSDGLEKMIAEAFEKYKLRRLCIDETGIGSFPAERIKKKHSERVDTPWRRPRVEPIRFDVKIKEAMATGMYTAFSSGAIRLPRTDAALPGCEPGTAKALRKDIASIQRIVTKAGNVTYDAPRTKNGHADRAWALALALHACSATNAMVDALTS